MSTTQGQTQTLSRSQARRVALAAQGFLDKPHAEPTMRTFDRTLARTGVLQVDSVNVLQRAHYMPLYSRMGPYDADPRTGLLARAAEKRPRRVVEYWAHVQAFMPVDLWPLMQHRMDFYRAARGKWWKDVEDSMIERVRVAVAAQPGPVTARELEQVIGSGGPRSKEHWGWNWSEARKTLDFLYQIGELAIAGRTTQFEVRYDLPERVLPAQILDLPVLDPQDAVTELDEVSLLGLDQTATAASLVEIAAAEARLGELKHRVLAHATAVRVEEATGAATTATWLARATRTTVRSSRRAVHLATALETYARLREGYAAGAVNTEQAEVIARALDALPTDIPATVKADAEQRLVDLAGHHDACDRRPRQARPGRDPGGGWATGAGQGRHWRRARCRFLRAAGEA